MQGIRRSQDAGAKGDPEGRIGIAVSLIRRQSPHGDRKRIDHAKDGLVIDEVIGGVDSRELQAGNGRAPSDDRSITRPRDGGVRVDQAGARGS